MTLTNQSAEEYLRQKIRVMREIGASQDNIDAATAQNVLHEDLGYFASKSAEYDLDQATRDKLLSHARQDAAHAVCAATTVAREVRRLRGMVAVMVFVTLALLAAEIWRATNLPGL